MKEKEYTFDASYQPQVRAKRDTRSVMLDVIIGLLPALAVGIWQFGAAILVNLVISIGVCVLFEYLYRHWMHKNNMIGDLSAVVTGLLMVLILPPSCPWWVIVIGDAFAIIVVKQLYGGLGKNFLNPALAGRAFLFSSYTAMLTTWSIPASLKGLDLGTAAVDATTMATPLSFMKAGNPLPDVFTLKAMFLGTMPGCVGEISALALLIGGAYLLIRKVISWHIPVAYIATVAILTLIAAPAGISGVDYMLYNVFGGGLMLGAIFMATDYATSPVTKPGQIIFGIGCGLLTCFIRRFGSYPEGVCYSILIMNCTTWLLDKYIRPTIYGAVKKEKKEAAK